MILVDTSIWISHLREADFALIGYLGTSRVLTHPFVIGELAMGHLARREPFLTELQRLPRSPVATDTEALRFIDHHRLAARGIGYIAAHLFVATRRAFALA